MPIYTFECISCGYTFDIDQSIKDKPLEVCEKCNGHLQKIISGTSFVLSGSGWAKDGYAKKS